MINETGRQKSPILGHIHVPKCAGTSFRHILDEGFGTNHLSLYPDDTFFVYSEAELTSLLLPSVLAFSSHSVRTFAPRLAEREVLYVAFLRDPLSQFVSYLHHVRRHFTTIIDAGLLSCLPPDLPQLSLRDSADWILTQERDINFRENYTVNFFARPVAGRLAMEQYQKERLGMVQDILSKFFFVGISERLDESLNLLRPRLARRGLELPSTPAPVLNVSVRGEDYLSWLNEHDRVGKRLLDSVVEDYALYRWAVARFPKQTD